MHIKKHIPNIITLLNLFCGCIALEKVAYLDFEGGFFFVCLGIFFDFFDGFFARKFGVAGPLGVQLDSLADMVTSGVVPGFVMYQLLSMKPIDPGDELYQYAQYTANDNSFNLIFLGFIITLGACYRLAKFNIDTRQSDSFIGLPTPANTLFIVSLPLIMVDYINNPIVEFLQNQWVLIIISLLSVYMMNAEIPLFSLKIKRFNLKDNALQILFMLTSIVLLVVFQYLGVAIVIVFYVLLSVIMNALVKKAAV